MSEIWFTSDTHFGHKNILEYEKEARPFDTVEEMNNAIITNWNKTVGKKDTVFHLGDFAFGRSSIGIAGQLNGRKKLIMGNHDTYSCHIYLAHFERLFGCYYWRRCILTHIPVHPEHLGSRFFLNAHGHMHSKVVKTGVHYAVEEKAFGEMVWVSDQNYFNVSTEQNNLTPINSDVIMQRLKEIDQ